MKLPKPQISCMKGAEDPLISVREEGRKKKIDRERQGEKGREKGR